MLKNTFKCLLFVLCSWLLVGPQFFLQMGAWGWMIVNYSKESSLAVGIQETFSGERPCGMCKVLQGDHDRNSPLPSKANAPADELRLLLPIAPRLQLSPPERKTDRMIANAEKWQDCHGKTPTPPPKHFA